MDSITISTEWPEDPTNLYGWISYGIALGLFPVLLILFAVLAPCVFSVVGCCRRYGKCGALPTDASDYTLRERVTAAVVTSVFIGIIIGATICLGVVAPLIREDVRGSVSTVTYAARGAAQFLDGFDESLDSLGTLISAVVNETLNETRQFPIEKFLLTTFDVQGTINLTQFEVDKIRSETVQVDSVLELLRGNLAELEQGQNNGSIPNFPITDSFPNSTAAEVEPTLNLIDANLQESIYRIDSLREQVLTIYLSLTTSSSINMLPIMQRIEDIKSSFQGQIGNMTAALESTVDQINGVRSSITFYDNIRMWALLALLGANIVLMSMFYLFFFAKRNQLLKVPLISIAILTVIMLIVTSVYFLVWQVNKDTCEKLEPYLQNPAVQASLKSFLGSDSTLDVSTNSTLNGTTAITSPLNKVLNAVLSDPMPLLYCSQESTIMELYSLDLLDIFALADVINETVSGGVQAFAEQMDTQTDITAALSQLADLELGLSDMRDTLDNYTMEVISTMELLANLTNQVSDLSRFGYNETLHLETMDEINNVTLNCCDLFYDIYNVSALDVNDPTFAGLSTQDRDNLQTNRDNAVAMTQGRQAAEEQIQPTVDLLNKMTNNFETLLAHFQSINGSIQNMLDMKPRLVGQLTTMEAEITRDLAKIYHALATVVDNVHIKTQSLEFGRCAWLGAFWAGGDPDNTGEASLHAQFCDAFYAHVTLSTFALLILCLAMIVTWALILVFRSRLKRPKTPPALGTHVHINPFMRPSSSAGQIAAPSVWAANPQYVAKSAEGFNPNYAVSLTVIKSTSTHAMGPRSPRNG